MNSQEEARRIAEALRAEVERGAQDDSVMELMMGTFRGRRRWMNALAWGMTLVMFILCIVCAVRFFSAQTTQAQIAWATGFLYFSMAVLGLKIWTWMEMLHCATSREVKRMEAMLAKLAETMAEK